MKKLTKQQRVAVGVLVVAVGALAADQVLSGGGASPAGASTPGPTMKMPSLSGETSKVDAATAKHALAGLAKMLQRHDTHDLAEIPDAFQPSQAWQRVLQPPVEAPDVAAPKAAAKPATPSGPSAAQRFGQAHRLMSIIRDEAGDGYALVDNRMMRIGRVVDGFTLVELTERTAVFESDEHGRVALKLAGPGAR